MPQNDLYHAQFACINGVTKPGTPTTLDGVGSTTTPKNFLSMYAFSRTPDSALYVSMVFTRIPSTTSNTRWSKSRPRKTYISPAARSISSTGIESPSRTWAT